MGKDMKKRRANEEEAVKTEVDSVTAEAAPSSTLTIAILQEDDGSEPYTIWLNALRDRKAKQRILSRINVVRRGSLGHIRPVGDGVGELKIDYGPGYRVYFGRKGNTLVVLIIGGDKDSQVSDIDRARELWKRYRNEIENV